MKIREFLDRRLGYVLIAPAIIFILLFSILPIVESTKYAFFDFQLNDQQKSGLYFNERYNLDLVNETYDYLDYYLETELDVVESDETKAQIDSMRVKLSEQLGEVNGIFGTNTGIGDLNESTTDRLNALDKSAFSMLDTLYARQEAFILEEDIYAVASELNTAYISPNYAGLDNFKNIMNDERVINALVITIIFTVGSVTLELVLGLVLALIMNKSMAGRGMIRTMSLIPWAIPTSVAALIWAYLYNGSNGIVAMLLAKTGLIETSADLLLTGSSALSAVIMADVWKTTPYMALLLLAGLQTIPGSLYEAASIDGATKWQQFMNITLPLLKPSIMVALLFRTLDAFRVFDLIWVLTGGGPGGKTESISIYAYKAMFAQTRFGYGSAVVLVMALVVGIISYAYIKLLDVQLVSGER